MAKTYYGEIVVYESVEHGDVKKFFSISDIKFFNSQTPLDLNNILPTGIEEYEKCSPITTRTDWVKSLSELEDTKYIHLITTYGNSRNITADKEFSDNAYQLDHVQYLKPPIIRFGIKDIPNKFNLTTMNKASYYGQFPFSFSVNIYDADNKELVASGHYKNNINYHLLTFEPNNKSKYVPNNSVIPNANEFFTLETTNPKEISHPSGSGKSNNSMITIAIILIVILTLIAVSIPIIKKKLN